LRVEGRAGLVQGGDNGLRSLGFGHSSLV
jgi:hypothetical protein